jgi:type II secretory pathway pseudopilin PulG
MSAKPTRRVHLSRGAVPGFTLIELMVSVGLFVVVMMVAVGSLIAVAGADQKAQAIQSVVNDLNFAIDDMSRNLRTGSQYHCDDGTGDTIGNLNQVNIVTPQDCSTNGSSYIALLDSNQDVDRIVYWFSSTCLDNPGGTPRAGYAGGCLERSTQSGATGTWVPLTSPNILLDDARFFTIGAPAADRIQPKVVMRLSAHLVVNSATTSLFMETSVTQRLYDTP